MYVGVIEVNNNGVTEVGSQQAKDWGDACGLSRRAHLLPSHWIYSSLVESM